MPSQGISRHDFRDYGKQTKSRNLCSGTVACLVSCPPWGREHSRLSLEIFQGEQTGGPESRVHRGRPY